MKPDIFNEEKKYFLNTYNRIPIDFSHGEGVHLVAKDGTRYLDFFSGLAVNSLGYNHPKINEAISRQIHRFLHLSNFFISDVQIEFAKKLLQVAGMSKIFLSNSGTEAVEGAIKAVRKLNGPDKTIFSFTNSFHGRTDGALSLTAKAKYKNDFKPLLPNTATINFNDIEDLRAKINKNTAAIFIEFIQGEGGINEVSTEFIDVLFALKNKYDFAVIADCIQTGIGRTGKPFAFNYYDVKPDIVLVAKSVGGGLPLGAMMTTGKFDEAFLPGSHGSTFGGNPVSCAAGLVVLKEVFENSLVDEVAEKGNYLKNELNELQKLFPGKILDIRGKGFMIGIEMSEQCTSLVEEMRKRKVLTNCTNQNILRLLPPFITSKEEIDYFLYSFHETLKIL